MAIETLKALFHRDLSQLRKEVELYKNEDSLWKIENNIANSAGNLCLQAKTVSHRVGPGSHDLPDTG